MNKVISIEEMVPLIIEQINNGGQVTFTPKGTSMLPMLRNDGDTVTLKKPEAPLKKYDLPLYINNHDKYILHRVIGRKTEGYVMRGDNQFTDEEGIRDEQVIGLVCEFTRKNKRYDCNSLSYKLYCRIWVNTIVVRKTMRKVRIYLRRLRIFLRRVRIYLKRVG